jgi:CheY-like chemotaxis protein
MFTCEQIWRTIDLLARRKGMSVSRLAIIAGLDATALNLSKRASGKGKPRWISMGTIAKILLATDTSPRDFIDMVCADQSQLDRASASYLRWIGARAQILVVDDDEEFGAQATTELGAAGYNVEALPDLRRALEIIESPHSFDLLITNLDLPYGAHGRILAHIALKHRAQLKCLFVTTVHPGDMPGGEAETILQKPIAMGNLVAIVNNLFAHSLSSPSTQNRGFNERASEIF